MSITKISGGALAGPVQAWPRGGFKATWWDCPALPVVQWRQLAPTSVTEIQTQDRIYSRSDGGLLGSDYYWPITRPEFSANTDIISNTSTDQTKLALDADLNIFRYVADGPSTIGHTSSARTVTATVRAKTSASVPVDTFLRYATGSYRKHAHDSINALLVGKNPSTDKRIWTVQDHTNLNYIRNPSCWLYDVDLTCLTPYNTSTGASLGATLFTPLHVMQCRHAPLGVGAVINFVALDGTVHQRTLVANTTVVPGYPTLTTDLIIGRLDSPLPSSIKPAPLPPATWASQIPGFSITDGSSYPANECRFPGFVLDRTEEIMCKDFAKISNYTSVAGQENFQIVYLKSLDATRALFDKTLTGGDSGNPVFWLVNGEAVLVSVHTGPGAGTFIGHFLTQIDAITQANGYTAARANLGGFNSY